MAAPDVRITVYDPLVQNVLALDASGDVGPDGIKYEDTPSGCGSGTFNLALHFEDLVAKGYWGIYDTVEVSTGDSVMTASCAAGATKIYVDSTAPFNTAAGEDTQQTYFWDGASLCMRVPVTGIGSDGGGPYITIGTPIAGGGNIATLPAYGIGTVVGRRRYAGRIIRRVRNNSREPKVIVTTIGFSDCWNRAYDNFVISYSSNIDVGAAIYQALKQNASRWPFFTITSGNFPTTGCIYSGSLQADSIAEFVQDAMTAIITGDYWALRVGHDRVPKLVRLFTLSTDTYAYNLFLPQGVAAFEPVNVVIQDDATNLFNSIEVIGNTDPTTKQPTSAIVQDALSIGYYGQIDGAPVTNLKAQTNAQCEINATSLVAENAAATQSNSMRIYVVSDTTPVNTPGGFLRGDVVKGLNCVFVTRFDGIGGVINALPDSGFQYVATNPGNQIANASLTTQNGWTLGAYCSIDTVNKRLAIAPPAATGPFVISQNIPCAPGVPVIYSGSLEIDAAAAGGDFRLDVIALNSSGGLIGTVCSTITFTAFQNATPFSVTGTTPAGTESVDVRFYFEETATSTPGPAYFYAPQLLIGSPSSIALWTNVGATSAIATPANAYGSTGNSLQVTSASGAFGYLSQPIDVVPGQVWTLQGTIDARSATGTGNVVIYVVNSTDSIVVTGALKCPVGSEVVGSAATAVTFTIPVGVTQISIQPQIPATVTIPASGIFFANIQLQPGSVATSYVQNNAAPVEYGLVSSVVTTIMPGGDQWQDVLFSPIEPNYNAIVAEATNAATTALQQNTNTGAGLDQYFVSANAFGYSISGLVVTAPSFQAVFALGTLPVNVGGNTFTLTANATNFVWLNPTNTWTINTAPTAVTGSILYAMFTCNSTTVIGSTNRASIGLLQVPASYFLGGVAFTPSLSGISVTNSIPSNITSQLTIAFEVTNQPTDGSHTKTNLYYCQQGQAYWLLLGTSPPLNGSGSPTAANAPSATGAYTFLFPDAPNGINYTFGVSLEGGASRETAIVSIANLSATSVTLPVSFLEANPTPTTAPTLGTPSPAIVSYVGANGSQSTGSYDAKITFALAAIATPTWLIEVRVYAVPHSGTPPSSLSGMSAYAVKSTLVPVTPASGGAYTAIVPGLVAGQAYDLYAALVDLTGIISYGAFLVTTAANPTIIGAANQASMGTPTSVTPSVTYNPATNPPTITMGGPGSTAFDYELPGVSLDSLGLAANTWGCEIELVYANHETGNIQYAATYAPQASNPYTFIYPSLPIGVNTDGTAIRWDLGVRYVDFQGQRSNVNFFYYVNAAPLQVGSPSLQQIPSSTTFSATSVVGTVTNNGGATFFAQVSFDLLITSSIPYSEWLDKINLYVIENTTGTINTGLTDYTKYSLVGQITGSVYPTPVVANFGPLGNNTGWQLAIALVDHSGYIAAALPLAVTGTQNSNVANTPGSSNTNFIADSNMDFTASNGASAYWSYAGFDPTRFHVNGTTGGTTQNELVADAHGGASVGPCCAYSSPINVVSGTQYTLTVQSEKTSSGGTCSYGIVSLADKTANNTTPATIYASQTSSTSGNPPIAHSLTWTATLTGQVVIALYVSSGLNGSCAWSAPQFELGAVFSGYKPGATVTSTGTNALAAAPTQVQDTITTTAGADGSYVASGVISGRHLSGASSGDMSAIVNSSGLLLSTRTGNIPRKNLVVNGNNANGTGSPAPGVYGWTGSFYSGTVISSGTYTNGSVTYAAMEISSAYNTGVYQTIPVTPGGTYTFMCLAYATSGATATIWIGDTGFAVAQVNATVTAPIGTPSAFYAGAASTRNSYSTNVNNQWQVLYGTFTVPSTSSIWNQVAVLLYNTAGTTAPVYFLGVQVFEGNRLQDFITQEPNTSGIYLDTHITDGTTYQRMPVSNMDANRRALIDFTQTAHVGKIIDNIPDGTTYAKVKLTELNAGAITRLNDGTNIRNAAQVSSVVAASANANGSYLVNGIVTRGATPGDASAAGEGVNLLFNPNITNAATDGTAGWSYGPNCGPQATYERLFINPPASTAGPFVIFQKLFVYASRAVTYSGLLEIDGAPGGSADFRCDVIAYNSSNTLLGTVCSTATFSAFQAATYFTITGTTPSTTSYVYVRFFMEGTAGSTPSPAYLYSPQLEYGSIATSYGDDQGANVTNLTHLPVGTAPADNSYLRTGVIAGRHLLGAASTDTANVVDSTGTLLLSRTSTTIQNRNLFVGGRGQLGVGAVLFTNYGGASSIAATGGTYTPSGASAMTVPEIVCTSNGGYYQKIPVKPNTTYSYSCLVYQNSATSAVAYVIITNPAFGVLNAAPGAIANLPSGIPAGYYSGASAVVNAESTTLQAQWVLMCGTFNSGNNTQILYFPAFSGIGNATFFTGAALWEGTKWQDYVDGAPHAADGTTPSSAGMNAQGSLLNVANTPVYSYSSTPTSVTISVPATTYTLTDGSTQLSVGVGNFPFIGLSASTTYWVDIAVSVSNAAYVCTAPNSKRTSAQMLADCFSDGKICIYANYSFTTPATGTGGGSAGGGSGGGGYCPAEYQVVETLERGIIRADQIDVGMHLRGPIDGPDWVRVNDAMRGPTTLWRFTVIASDETIESFDVNESHMCMRPDGSWLGVSEMQPGDQLKGRLGDLTVTSAENLGPGFYIGLDVDGHLFSMGSTCAHNIISP